MTEIRSNKAKKLANLDDLYIPKPNEFIPKNFDVDKVPVETVGIQTSFWV